MSNPTVFPVLPELPSTYNSELAQQLQQAIEQKTKPPGSLGRLESLAKQLGLLWRTCQPQVIQPSIVVFAADHGVTAENISAFPQDVTWQMVENFLAGGAAINVFARQQDCQLLVVDAGVKHNFTERAGLLNRKIAWGTKNMAQQAAMSQQECAAALQAGMAVVGDLPGNVLGLGEMGIGNTTAAAALMQRLTGLPLALCVGAGTGLSPQRVEHKQTVVARALATHAQADHALDVLACLGGLEIAMLVGAMLAAAAQRKLIVIDGFIVTSALLVAHKLQPNILDYCIFAHCSEEKGHAALLAHLGVRPLLSLELRLGEGSGAALALPLVQAAAGFLTEMASFATANVSHAVPVAATGAEVSANVSAV